ncbi:uncharacterized protein LOC135826785 [Sycon ciliatum]|uniref:uncharacterized protein LOC135826785 n=1 Tax=Sycon ciliatum TaxID=27933 RepID=UPI0031F642AA
MATSGGSESVLLAKFVETHDLPCTVTVMTGYSCGTGDEDDSLSQGEVITLHSVQQDEVVHATDHVGRQQILPAIGSRKYQLLPENPEHDSVLYETVQDLINDVQRPEKVRVTASVDSGDEESTVYMDDILTIVKVEAKQSPRTGYVQPMLVATNSLGETLRLPTDTPGKFSAQLDIKWYSMAEIITKGEFPVRVSLVRSHPAYQSQGLDRFTITCTSLSRNVLVTVNKELLVMPVETQIEVMFKEDDGSHQLYTMISEDAADDEYLDVDDDDNLPPPPPDAEMLIAGDVPDEDVEPTKVQPPPVAKKPKPPPVATRPKPAARRHSEHHKSLLTDIEAVRLRMGSVRTFGTSRRISSTDGDVLTKSNPSPEQVRDIFRSLNEHTAKTNQLQEESNKWQSRCSRLNNHYQSIQKQLEQLERAEEFWKFKVTGGAEVDAETQKLCDDFKISSDAVNSLTVSSLSASDDIPFSQATASDDIPPPPATEATVQAPAQVPFAELTWATLDQAHIQQLLASLNMNQYKEKFSSQQVDGGLLLELDEESLENDLGMKSALHRKKIVRTITGKGLQLSELLKA